MRATGRFQMKSLFTFGGARPLQSKLWGVRGSLAPSPIPTPMLTVHPRTSHALSKQLSRIGLADRVTDNQRQNINKSLTLNHHSTQCHWSHTLEWGCFIGACMLIHYTDNILSSLTACWNGSLTVQVSNSYRYGAKGHIELWCTSHANVCY